MKRPDKLTSLNVQRIAQPGLYCDRGREGARGLYLQVTVSKDGAVNRSWLYRFAVHGRTREMGLGSLRDVGLGDARDRAREAFKLKDAGVDPIEARRAAREQQALDVAKAITFKQEAESFLRAQEEGAGWKNQKHRKQWAATLETYAYPVIGHLGVQSIDRSLIIKVLEPIWTTKGETARRLRGRIEAVLDWSTARGNRSGENPASRHGPLLKGLPKLTRKKKHHPALPYAQLPAFLDELRVEAGIAARALEFTILTAARSNESLGSRPSEINLRDKVWTVPASRMKGEREHRVPLSDRAFEIAEEAMRQTNGEFLFPGQKSGRPLSDMSMTSVIRRMNDRAEERGRPRYVDPKEGGADVVPHGFRSTFRDWASERTNFPREIAEAALAHIVGDETEAAYKRGDVLEKRRRLMDGWAGYCATPTSFDRAVVNLRHTDKI